MVKNHSLGKAPSGCRTVGQDAVLRQPIYDVRRTPLLASGFQPLELSPRTINSREQERVTESHSLGKAPSGCKTANCWRTLFRRPKDASPSEWFSTTRTVAAQPALKHQGRIVAAKAEGVREGDIHLLLAGLVWHEVQVTFGVRVDDVHRGRQDAVMQS